MDAKSSSSLLHHYSDLLVKRPLAIFCTVTLLSIIFPSITLYFNRITLNINPEAGFDTRGTEYSANRNAWDQISWNLQQGNRLLVSNSSRTKRSWADDLLNAFGQVSCYEAPIPGMDFLSQFIIQVDSYDDIFQLELLKMVCSLHSTLNQSLLQFQSVTPYRNIWSISNYVSCLSPNYLTNCSHLTNEDVSSAKALIEFCLPYRKDIISCNINCINCEYCKSLPENCSAVMLFDLFYRILPIQLDTTPIYINAFLPIFTFAGYQSRGFYNATLQNFLNVQNDLRKFSNEHPKFILKGLSLDVKRNILFEGAMRDSSLALGAAFCVFIMIFLYSMNIIFCIGVALILAASVFCALAVYSLFVGEFPLLNLVVFVLLLAIGSDDAFVLLNSFPTTISEKTIRDCMSHTASAMFLTSTSTAVPFFTSILSSVIVFRCFGFFAGLTLLFNYLFEISFLPALLILQNRYIRRCSWSTRYAKCRYVMRDLLPVIIISGRYIWIVSLFIVTTISLFVSYNYLSFPQYNPLQLFVNSNEHEWYDSNAESLFDFVKNKSSLKIFIRLIWGLNVVDLSDLFSLDKRIQVTYDNHFTLNTTANIQDLAQKLETYRGLDFIRHDSRYWPERYLDWSANLQCEPDTICCNRLRKAYNEVYTDYCIRISTAYLYTQYNDTPIYDNITYELIGYTALLPTTISYSHRYENLSSAFTQIRASFHEMNGWYTSEWSLLMIWFDLLSAILHDCCQSIYVSFAVVTVFTLVHLRLKSPIALFTIANIVVVSVGFVVAIGWTVGVLEAMILVLIVGLSFDFTLHYGASVPDFGCNIHRVQAAARKSSIPVSLSALSSILAGSLMIFAETHAFYQVGIFLITSASLSWIFATFFFLPLLSIILPANDSCKFCRKPLKLNVVTDFKTTEF